MLDSILKLFGLRSRRLIFRYRVAGRSRRDDPLRVDAMLAEAGGIDWRDTVADVARLQKPLSPTMAESLGADEVKARREKFEGSVRKLVTWSRKAFDLSELDRDTGKGVTDGEAIDTLVQYLEFSESLWETARPFR